jgi:hypothetical protein
MINDTKYTDDEFNILMEISNYCECDCGNKENRSEEECILFRVERIISGNRIT